MYRSHALMLWALLWPGTVVLAQCPAMIDAAAKSDIDKVSSLLAGGSDPNCVDNSNVDVKGWTPMMAAAKAGSVDVVEALLKAHANVNARNGYGATALDVAVANGHSSDVGAAIVVAGGKGREEYPISVSPRSVKNTNAAPVPASPSTAQRGTARAGVAPSTKPSMTGKPRTAKVLVESAGDLANGVPFAETVKQALVESGFTVSDSAQTTDDLLVRVTTEVSAYGSFGRWTKAEVKGQIILTKNGSTVGQADFAGIAEPVTIILSNSQNATPADAPFPEAFEKSKFREIVTRLIKSLPEASPRSVKNTNGAPVPVLAAKPDADSQQKQEVQTTHTKVLGAVCKIDAINKTIRVLLWDVDAKKWKRDSLKNLAWNEQTQLSSSGKTLTMPEFLGGKPLSQQTSDASAIQGNRAAFYITIIDGREVVQKMEMAALFNGESFPAMVGSGGAVMFGGSKVSCGDGSR
jgi:hypothetical protein